eukprot:IDg12467t1
MVLKPRIAYWLLKAPLSFSLIIINIVSANSAYVYDIMSRPSRRLSSNDDCCNRPYTFEMENWISVEDQKGDQCHLQTSEETLLFHATKIRGAYDRTGSIILQEGVLHEVSDSGCRSEFRDSSTAPYELSTTESPILLLSWHQRNQLAYTKMMPSSSIFPLLSSPLSIAKATRL